MKWVIADDDPSEVAGHPDGDTWRWRVRQSDTGAIEHIDVCVNRTVTQDCYSLRAREAHVTHGKSEVERLLRLDQPPPTLYVWRDGAVTETPDRG